MISSHTHMGYTRVAKRCRGSKGLRLNMQCRRFSVQGLKSRFIYLFKQMSRWRSYIRFIIGKMGMKGSAGNIMAAERNNRCGGGGWRCRRSLVMPNEVPLRSSSLGSSNSFYSEAISDCLEFIKRNSVSDVDHKPPVSVCYVAAPSPKLHCS